MPASVATPLLDHYQHHARALPWRTPPGSKRRPDPYAVWLSEVMLQQTTVAAVIPRFLGFIQRWPTVEALAAAAEDDVLGQWAGLGYYARARNLVACARQVMEMGGFPDTEMTLRALPGIGNYTAAAIAAIAFGQDAVAIDTNVERIVARLNATSDKAAIRDAAKTMLPPRRAGDFAQAMMDLGATVCRPRAPACAACPLAGNCRAFQLGSPEAFPVKAKRKPRPVRYGISYWIERSGAVWLVRRPAKGMLGGMAALPGPEWTDQQATASALAEVRHVFTHFELRLSVVARDGPEGEGWWQPLESLAQAGLPTLYRRAADAVLERRRKLAA